MLGEHNGREKKISSTEGFFRKSTFCALMNVNPRFGGQWDMS